MGRPERRHLRRSSCRVDGETEFELLDWEVPGEIIEFSFRTKNGGWLAEEITDHSFYSFVGLDWANSDPGELPYFFEQGFYFYYAKDGEPVKGYETQLEDIGLAVGEHPFDESVEEVVYIDYSRGQVEEVTKPYEGGTHVTGGTTQLDENDASWAALLQTMGIAPSDQNELHLGILVDPPRGDEIVFEKGDTNLDGAIDAADIDLLFKAVNENSVEAQFDINDDGSVNSADPVAWIEDVNNTYSGDANLDGEFNSGDLVAVFGAGLYETKQPAGWAQGDWNGDMVFDSGDLVVAFAGGGYEEGVRGVAAVPEPSSLVLLLMGGLFVMGRARRTSSGRLV